MTDAWLVTEALLCALLALLSALRLLDPRWLVGAGALVLALAALAAPDALPYAWPPLLAGLAAVAARFVLPERVQAPARLPRWAPYAYYAGLGLLVLRSFLPGGYFLSLDAVFGPRGDAMARLLGTRETLAGHLVWKLPTEALGALIGADHAILLLVLLPILPLAGLGAHRLAGGRGAAAYLAGTLYALNAFVYARLVAGQIYLLWGYALLPFFVHAWLALLDKPTTRRLGVASALLGLVLAAQAHVFILALMAAGALALAHGGRRPWAPLARLGIASAFALLLNAFWILPLLLHPTSAVGAISTADYETFAPHAWTGHGLPLELLTLHGFWRDGVPYAEASLGAAWLVPGLLLVALGVFGLALGIAAPRTRRTTLALAAAGAAGLLLALSTAQPPASPLSLWRWELPLAAAFRDGQKFIVLLALAYAWGAALALRGLATLARRLPARWATQAAAAGVVLALAVPVVVAAPLVNDLEGMVEPTQYPESWADADAAMQASGKPGHLLVLPWHHYLDLPWLAQSQPRIAIPAEVYFSRHVMAGDNIEIEGQPTQSSDPRSAYLEALLADLALLHGNPRGVTQLGNLLAPLGVSHVLLLKTADWERYANVLAQQEDLRLVLERDDLLLYENARGVAGVATTRAWVEVRDVVDALEAARTLDLNRTLLVPGVRYAVHEGDGGPARDDAPRVLARVPTHGRDFVALAAPHEQRPGGWSVPGARGVPTFTGEPAFDVTDAGDEVALVHWPTFLAQLPGIAITLAWCVVVARLARERDAEAAP